MIIVPVTTTIGCVAILAHLPTLVSSVSKHTAVLALWLASVPALRGIMIGVFADLAIHWQRQEMSLI